MPRRLAVLAALVVAAGWPPVSHALPQVDAEPFAFDDPGARGAPGGWRQDQWALTGRWGVRAEDAWEHVAAAGRPGGAGTVVAVLDSGVAYRATPRYRRSPDVSGDRVVRGFDALRGRRPLDPSGHGTHVASTVAAAAGNGAGLVGLAYRARVMPVRVLDARGAGAPGDISRGIRWAVRHGADVLALAFAFAPGVSLRDLPDVDAALDEAHRRGVVVVAAAGNDGGTRVALPARHRAVIAVGASTSGGCRAASSNHGPRLDLVAPGGGPDADVRGDEQCRPGAPRRAIPALGFRRPGPLRVLGRDGTSHAVPHVAATAALVLASGVLGDDPSPDAVRTHLRRTARDLGRRGRDHQYGAGLLDAAAATRPRR